MHSILLALALGARAILAPATVPAADSLLVSPSWLSAHLADPGLVVIETGGNSESYQAGHIPGARFIPLSAIVVTRDGLPNELPEVAALEQVLEGAGIGESGRIVIYGDPLPAARLFFTLDYLGLGGRAALLDGGLPAWKKAGGAVTSEVPPPRPGSFTPHPRPDLVVTADWVQSHLGDSSVALIDARPPAEYRGDPAGAEVTRGGHIPGAASYFWRWSLNPGEPATLKDPAVLAKLLARAGAAPGKVLVSYCRTGVQASHLYFALRYMGYAPKLYDGSYLEWNRGERPVER
ncbi:MAG: sulfurtransferase [Gemmatimonadales bacterium]